jgi:hypothetical protein
LIFSFAAGLGDDDGCPVGAFEKDVHRLFGAAGMLAAHDARDALGPLSSAITIWPGAKV